jgi:hypothetical protein
MSGYTTTTANDLIIGALLNTNAVSAGQNLSNTISSACMQVCNDLLDSLSTDQAFVYTQVENIVAWTPGQYQYSIGNPTAASTFAGNCTSGSPTISGVTNVASLSITFGLNGTGGTLVGGTITDFYNAIPAGTTIVSVNAGANTVTMSQNATLSTAALGTDIFTYTVPGNFCFPRPLRIRNGFTRVTTSAAAGLDYWFDVQTSLDRYNEIGLKSVPGPWPYLASYQPTFPYGTLWIYPNPSIAGAVYLYTDYILSQLTSLTQLINLPQGYNRALKKLLALELCPMFGKTPSPMLITQAKEARAFLKSLNTSPQVTLRYDSDLVYSRHTDASWVVSGGFV